MFFGFCAIVGFSVFFGRFWVFLGHFGCISGLQLRYWGIWGELRVIFGFIWYFWVFGVFGVFRFLGCGFGRFGTFGWC